MDIISPYFYSFNIIVKEMCRKFNIKLYEVDCFGLCLVCLLHGTDIH
jgi:hypothetical protein